MSRAKTKITLTGCGDDNCVIGYITDHQQSKAEDAPYSVERIKARLPYNQKYFAAKFATISGTEYQVELAQSFPNANRTVLSLVKATMDCPTTKLKLITMVDGNRCANYLKDGTTDEVDGAIWHGGARSLQEQDSLSFEETWRVYLDAEVAEQINQTTVFEHEDKRYAVVEVHDLGKVGAIPYAITHRSRWPLG